MAEQFQNQISKWQKVAKSIFLYMLKHKTFI